jgi:hypothetical protein
MECLTSNQQSYVVKPQPQACNPIPQRWLFVVQLHLAGHKIAKIAEATGYTENSVYRILNHEDVNAVRQQLLDSTQKEFEALFPKVVDAIGEGLDDPDPKVRAIYTSQWLKANGKFTDNKTIINNNITAEDVVTNILNAPSKK